MKRKLKLSTAILRGCKIAKKKCRSVYVTYTGRAACVLGAAAIGAGCLPSCNSIDPFLCSTFPHIFNCGWIPEVEEAVKRNDNTSESRESIARWLKRKGL